MFAWEWLRRTPSYRRAWRDRDQTAAIDKVESQQYGLERFEDPAIATPLARPIWSAALDPMVIQASIADPSAAAEERIDLRELSHLVSLAIGGDQSEHLLLSDGLHALRIDILKGTLIGCPSALRYDLRGITRLRGPIAALERLMTLAGTGHFARSADRRPRHDRWILELRVADALAEGRTYQDMARALFGATVPSQRWRREAPSYRQRVQRLVKHAQANLSTPLNRKWFNPFTDLGRPKT